MPLGNLATQSPSFLICMMGIAREPSPVFHGEGWHTSFAFCVATTFLSSTDKFEWHLEAKLCTGRWGSLTIDCGNEVNICPPKEKKKHHLKVDTFVSFEGITEDDTLGKQPLSSSKGLYQRGK